MAREVAPTLLRRPPLRAAARGRVLPARLLAVSPPLLADAPGESCDPRRGDPIHVTLEYRHDFPTESSDGSCTPASFRSARRGCLHPVDETPEGPMPAPHVRGAGSRVK